MPPAALLPPDQSPLASPVSVGTRRSDTRQYFPAAEVGLGTNIKMDRGRQPRSGHRSVVLVCTEANSSTSDTGLCGAARLALKTIGLISDTHGLLRPEAVRALAGVERIVHAGDIGSPEILEELRTLAPVDAVRGNNDRGRWAARIPASVTLTLGAVRIHVIHDVKELQLDPRKAGFDVVISGHSHKPAVTERDGVQFVNPGSAGPRRFSLPVTIGYLDIGAKVSVAARILKIV